MKTFVLGGDGFCGWPTSLHLSIPGHDVLIIDNLCRRNRDNALGAGSLTPIPPMGERLRAWHELTGQEIRFERLDISEHRHRLLALSQVEQRT